MLVLDCESRGSALESLSTIYGVPADSLAEFLETFDLDAHYAKNNPNRPGNEELRIVVESSLGRKPAQIDRVFWFHLTRARKASDFADGIEPLTASLDRVWRTMLDVFRGTEHEVQLRKLRQSGVPDYQYDLKVGKAHLAGPYAMLVREVAFCPREIRNHDYLRLPEIMEDICNGYQEVHGESIHDTLERALMPIIVKFWSTKRQGLDCIEAALYYLHSTAHNQPLNYYANTCFDAKNEAIVPEQIVRVETIDCGCKY